MLFFKTWKDKDQEKNTIYLSDKRLDLEYGNNTTEKDP